MKKKIISIVIGTIVAGTAFYTGRITANANLKAPTPTEEYIKCSDIIDWSATETGLLITLKDGNGYYWER